MFLILSVIGVISTKKLDESPKFLHNEGKYEEARIVLGKIAYKNKLKSLSESFTNNEIELTDSI